MAGICTARTSPNGCNHHNVTITLDGEPFSFIGLHEDEANQPLTAHEKEQFVRYAIRRARTVQGVTLANLLGRVTHGDEATNVKVYDFFGPGAVITRTNIGTNYVNICPGVSGERVLVDFTGCTEFRPLLTANLVAAGPFQVRIVKDSDNTVLYESPSIAQTGERELDPGWQAIPQGFSGQEWLRIQAKSATATDDPVFRRAAIGLR